MAFEEIKIGSETDLKLREFGATEGLLYKPHEFTIVTHANETLGGLCDSLLITHLRTLIPSLNPPDINAKGGGARGGGGDEINRYSESKILESFAVYINGFMSYPDSLCLSTLFLLSSSELYPISPHSSLDSNGDMKSL